MINIKLISVIVLISSLTIYLLIPSEIEDDENENPLLNNTLDYAIKSKHIAIKQDISKREVSSVENKNVVTKHNENKTINTQDDENLFLVNATNIKTNTTYSQESVNGSITVSRGMLSINSINVGGLRLSYDDVEIKGAGVITLDSGEELIGGILSKIKDGYSLIINFNNYRGSWKFIFYYERKYDGLKKNNNNSLTSNDSPTESNEINSSSMSDDNFIEEESDYQVDPTANNSEESQDITIEEDPIEIGNSESLENNLQSDLDEE